MQQTYSIEDTAGEGLSAKPSCISLPEVLRGRGKEQGLARVNSFTIAFETVTLHLDSIALKVD